MKTFKTENHGEFSATLVMGKLSLHGEKDHEHIKVPDYMLAEAGRLMRRESGDDVLSFAELCNVHEVALLAWEDSHA